MQSLVGPLRNSTYQTYRVAKVTGCAAWLAADMKKDFDALKAPSGGGKTWKAFGSKLGLLERGLKHELAMCQFVEDHGFSFVKRFEGHERVPKDYRKRAEAVSVEFKKEKQAAAKPKPAQLKQKQGSKPRTGKAKGCWGCGAMGHNKIDCPFPTQERGK